VTDADEKELLRLTNLLESLRSRLDNEPSGREALQKAGLALSVSFIHGLRPEVERLYATVGKPLPEVAREHLRQLGLDPDDDDVD
jgi:hypothetical protein